MMKSKYLFTLPILIFLFSACGNEKDRGGQPRGAGQVKDYPVLTVTPVTTTLYSDYPAVIEGQENVEIRPKIDGYIDRIYVDEGSVVKKGQLMFKISAPQYEEEVRTALANIKIAEAKVNAAQMDVNKVKPLVEKNIISEYELQAAEYTLQSNQAALAQAKAMLANARTNLGYTSVTSPVNGVVGAIPFKIGSLVSSNTAQPLTTVSNIKNIYAYFSINEKQMLEFNTETGGGTNDKLKSLPPVSLILANGNIFSHQGKIETATGLINTETGSVRVRAVFPNPDRVIRSGGTGSVRIPSTVKNAILVPQKSTYEIQGKKFVYEVGDSATVKSVEIKIRDNSDGLFYVVENGLKAGDKIVLEGVAGLREGMKIDPRTVNADSVYSRSKPEAVALSEK